MLLVFGFTLWGMISFREDQEDLGDMLLSLVVGGLLGLFIVVAITPVVSTPSYYVEIYDLVVHDGEAIQSSGDSFFHGEYFYFAGISENSKAGEGETVLVYLDDMTFEIVEPGVTEQLVHQRSTCSFDPSLLEKAFTACGIFSNLWAEDTYTLHIGAKTLASMYE